MKGKGPWAMMLAGRLGRSGEEKVRKRKCFAHRPPFWPPTGHGDDSGVKLPVCRSKGSPRGNTPEKRGSESVWQGVDVGRNVVGYAGGEWVRAADD